jgi:predicted dehydrogenase
MTIKLGIIGTGGMAGEQAKHFKKIPGVELASCFDVVDGRAAAFAEKHGVARGAGSLEELLAEVDAVTVVTPDRAHHQNAIEVLAARKHLLCEKPLTITLKESREVVAAYKKARKKGVIGMVNFSYRRSAALQKAIEIVSAGGLGEVRLAHGFYLQSWLAAPIWGHWTEERWLWRIQKAAGSEGVLGDVGCHLLDMATSVTGDVKRIRCWLSTFPKIGEDGKAYRKWQGKKLDANDTAVIELELASGGVGVLQTSRWAAGHNNHLRLEVHGTRGALRFDLESKESKDFGYERLERCQGEGLVARDPLWQAEELAQTPSNYQRFITAIERGEVDQPDILRGAQVQAYQDACLRSAESGKWEKVKRWE